VQEIFRKLLEMSMLGSLLALAVIAVRLIFRKAPRWIYCVLWGMVAVRLILPFSVESKISAVPASVATGQILNQVAKTRYIFGGKAKIPLVIRGQQGVGRGNAATHSQSLEALFMHFPGLKLAMPSTADDAVGLLRTAIRDDNPVIFIEHKALYVSKGQVNDDPDYCIPFGKARIAREGTDVTVVATHTYVQKAINVAQRLEKEGISVEVIDPRTLVPLDMDTITESVKKTGRAVVVHEAHKVCGIGAEIASQISETAFHYLDAPVERLGAKSCPLPFNLNLENAVVPQEQDIYDAIKRTLYL